MRNPLTVEAFADWCEHRSADEEYSFHNACGCAFASYLKSVGFHDPIVGGFNWAPDWSEDWRPLPHPEMAMALVEEPRTYGALASRLRELEA